MIIQPLYNRTRQLIALLLIAATQFAYAQNQKNLTEEQQIAFDTHFINGNRFLMLKMGDEAFKELKEAIRINPNEATSNYLISQLYVQKGLLNDAEIYALKAYTLAKDNTWFLKQLAEIYAKQKQFKKAGDLYANQLSSDTKNLNVLFDATYMYIMGRELNSALKLLNKTEKLVGLNEQIIRQKQHLFQLQGKHTKAIAEAQKLVNNQPQNMRYLGELADAYVQAGNPTQALKLYHEILTKEPENGYALLSIAEDFRMRHDTESWFMYLKKAVSSRTFEIKPKMRVIVEFISGKEFGINQLNKALELAHLLVEFHTDESSAWLLLGDVYAQNKHMDKAHEQYLKAVERSPDNFGIWQQLVYSATELRNHQLVVEDCLKAIELFPNEPLFYAYAAFSSYQLKNYQQCIDISTEGSRISQEQPNYLQQLLATMGDAAYHLKKYELSDSAYEAALIQEPDNAYVLNNYAYFLSLRKTNLTKAAEMSKRSIELEPRNASYYDTYGWILFVQKKYSEAKIQIEQSLKLAPNNAEVIDHYGDVLYFLGDNATAVKQWEKAKSLQAENPVLDKKISTRTWYEN